jgi:hypothetical protein
MPYKCVLSMLDTSDKGLGALRTCLGDIGVILRIKQGLCLIRGNQMALFGSIRCEVVKRSKEGGGHGAVLCRRVEPRGIVVRAVHLRGPLIVALHQTTIQHPHSTFSQTRPEYTRHTSRVLPN